MRPGTKPAGPLVREGGVGTDLEQEGLVPFQLAVTDVLEHAGEGRQLRAHERAQLIELACQLGQIRLVRRLYSRRVAGRWCRRWWGRGGLEFLGLVQAISLTGDPQDNMAEPGLQRHAVGCSGERA